MGGSLGLAARERAGVAEVRGYSQTQATLEQALERGAVTRACGSLEEACDGAGLIFVCTPVRLVVTHVRAALRAAAPHAVVTDVGSTKGPLMRALSAAEQRRCIGGHPLCGSEAAGVANARASLYQDATYFVTPGAHVDDYWDLRGSHGWYDLTVSDERPLGFVRRFAGHVETGRPSTSDPAIRTSATQDVVEAASDALAD